MTLRRTAVRKALCATILVLVMGLWSGPRWAQEARGTLVFDVKEFTSEVKLKEKVEKQLKSGGLEWGVADGQLVVSMVSKRFIKFDLPNFTRYTEKDTIELEPGEYRITCIGFSPEGGMSVEKALEKGAYFNLDVLTFQVKAGETTTLEVHPKIQKHTSFFLVKTFTPELHVQILQNGTAGEERFINERTDASVAWEDYKGPLKL
jgi:hypothetical protein